MFWVIRQLPSGCWHDSTTLWSCWPWERWSGIDQKLTSVCCGWDNRGVAIGEGMLFLGQLDANVVALDIKTGKEVWKTPIEV